MNVKAQNGIGDEEEEWIDIKEEEEDMDIEEDEYVDIREEVSHEDTV